MYEYDTGVFKVECETEEQLALLKGMYPDDDDLPCPPPPKGVD